jgi:diacylglycerol kinase (ATP)
MSSYVDVETSPEALAEDEELIEAVEKFAGKVSETVRTEIESEVSDLVQRIRVLAESLFPVLIEYQHDRGRIREDLFRLALFVGLLTLSFVVLAPLRPVSSSGGGNHHPKEKRRSWLGRSDSGSSLLFFTQSPRSDEELSETSERLAASSADYAEQQQETDEERFERVWPSLATSRIRKLILPPTCRKIVGKQLQQEQKKKKKDHDKKKKDKGDKSKTAADDDNPEYRLQNYVRQVLYVIKSLITYDYVGAGWTLILWLQGIIRVRRYRRNTVTSEMEHPDDDDETEAGGADDELSIRTSTSAVRRQPQHESPDDEVSVRSGTSAANSRQRPQPLRPGTPDDESSVRTGGSSSAARRQPLHLQPETPFATPLPENASMVSSPGSVSGEEKKEQQPSIPLPGFSSRERQKSGESVYYETTGRESLGNGPSLGLPSLQQRRSGSSQKQLFGDTPHVRSSTHPTLTPIPSPERGLTPAATPDSQLQPDLVQPDLSATDATTAKSAEEPGVVSQSRQSLIHYFDTAGSKASLKKLHEDVPVPDKNGYVLDEDFLPDKRYNTPLLVFVNSRSGPQQGHLLITQLRRLLNPIQVWDLADGEPGPVLESFSVFSKLRILVCGGDGTVRWIASALEKMSKRFREENKRWPPIAILPLGTGNDLARLHGWGGGYNNESLISILEQISESYISLLDRWEVTITDKKGKKKEVKDFFNYLGVGADAQAALQVHYLRESRPEWFFSRMVNKAMYGVFGAEDIIKASNVHVRKEIKLVADGVEVPLPPDSQGIILLNIDSYAGGVPLWSHGTRMVFPTLSPRRTQSFTAFDHSPRGIDSLDRVDSGDDLQKLLTTEERYARVTACDMESSCQDGYLDVVSIRGALHLGQIKVGLGNAQRLCQCREAVITIKNKIAVQVDGEPWRQRSCTLTITRKKEPAVMLHRSVDDGGVETEMSRMLEWAEERKLIDKQVHSILMKEFSRRIESKTRQRRFRAQDNIMSTLKKAISSGAMLDTTGHSSGGIAF